jgi:hypothetical protein
MLALAALLFSSPAAAFELNPEGRPYALRLHGELGFVGFASHFLQFGNEGTYLDLKRDAGQDVLFPFARVEGDLVLGRHTVTLLYQPLDVRTRIAVVDEVRAFDTTFAAGTPMDFRYGFSFWRGSWTYDVAPGDLELRFGLSLQIRNAELEWGSVDGTQLESVRNIGPVPILKGAVRGDVSEHVWMAFEIDGFYAPIKYINGSDNDVVGAIADASLRVGLNGPEGIHPFLNVRWIGGGAEGTSRPDDPGQDGFTRNWLHTLALSVGTRLE